MAHYIDKNALVAEIKKRRNKHFNSGGSPSSEYCYEDNKILGIIDTLEVKKVDLKKDVDKILEENDWDCDEIDFYDFAKHFFELGLKAQKGE